jgi:pimeloyl-ACP methyl ester carboxylesterase
MSPAATPRRIRPPAPGGLFTESFGALELARLTWYLPQLLTLRPTTRQRVLVMPGFGAGDESTLLLRAYLNALGHRAEGWNLGRNSGDVPALLDASVRKVAELQRQTGEPVSLVGWSLGGYIAREVARELPGLVTRVITLGSPVVGGPKYTAVAGVFGARGESLDAIEAMVDARYAVPLRVPVTAIFSKRDRVVAWQACIDDRSPEVEHVEVRTTHIGLGFAPEVYRIVADRLARSATKAA